MNRNQAKQLLPIIQAYVEGKTIQSRCVKGDTSLWYDEEDPSFDDDFEYRIKPEQKPKYRPFANAEECWKEMLKHQPFGWVKEKERNVRTVINYVHNDGVMFSCGSVLFERLFDIYTFADGTPFGVKLEE